MRGSISYRVQIIFSRLFNLTACFPLLTVSSRPVPIVTCGRIRHLRLSTTSDENKRGFAGRTMSFSCGRIPPVVIGGVGGGGTRVVSRLLAELGFDLGPV